MKIYVIENYDGVYLLAGAFRSKVDAQKYIDSHAVKYGCVTELDLPDGDAQ